MKLLIVEEINFVKDNKIIKGLFIKELEIPNELLEKFKTAFEKYKQEVEK